MKTIIPATFSAEVLEADGIVVLFARRSTCGMTCRCETQIEPTENFYRLSIKFVGYFFEDYPEFSTELGLMNVASARIYQDGEPVGEDINLSRYPDLLQERLVELTA